MAPQDLRLDLLESGEPSPVYTRPPLTPPAATPSFSNQDLEYGTVCQPEYGDFHQTPSQLRSRVISLLVVDQKFKVPNWQHPNVGGEAKHVNSPSDERDTIRDEMHASKENLGEWMSTAISGNDILSSVLFTAGLTTSTAGKLAPVAQVIVSVLVYCLRFIMEEVMSAVPLNGGSYTALMNSASKRTASFAAVFSVLSYVATGVVCAVSAFNYVNYLVELPVVLCSVAMLFVFACLCLVGIAESAIVALLFFAFHALTLTILIVFCIIYAVQNPSVFMDNMNAPFPDITMFGSAMDGSVLTALLLGYGQALLSVTGFESSAQFVEEQASGVFPKTLRNMWAFSSVFNIAFSFLALAVVPVDTIMSNKEVLLAYMGNVTSGKWLEILVTIDAFVVLSGAVLTSYVGITGLTQRLAIDRLMPSFLLKKNNCRNTAHYIIFGYFLVASSLVFILDAQVDALAGVFAFAFLGVMASFAVGCVLLKVHRDQLPRATETSWTNVLFCLIMVVFGFVCNAMNDLEALKFFVIYFAIFFLVVYVMLERVTILTAVLYVSKQVYLWFNYDRRHRERPERSSMPGTDFVGNVAVAKTIERIKRTPLIFFCKTPNLPKINEAVSYVMKNEQTYSLRLVHVCEKDGEIPREFQDVVCLFDHIYPTIKIDFVSIYGSFDTAMVEWISRNMDIPTNMMLMRQPATDKMHEIASMGVRVITD